LSGEKLELQVTGVLQDLPENTHLALDILVFLEPSMFDAMPNILNTWTSVNTYTYFKLKPGRSVQEFQGRVTYWLDYESPLREMVGPDVVPSSLVKLKIMSLRDLHLRAIRDAGSMGDMKPMGNFSTVIAFASIAALILVLASINFMNLSTARASMRAKEVAIRKIMGASRRQLIVQFIGEAVLISLFALLIALVGVELLLSAYSDSVGKSLTTEVFENGIGVAVLIGVALLLGVVSGTYPALYLSRYLPAHTLKSTRSASTGQNKVRSVLVVVQFSATIFLAACTLVIYGQTLYARSMDVGYEYQDKLVLEGLNGSQARRVRESLVEELKRIDGVTSVTVSSEVPSQDRENNTGFQLLNPPEGARADGVIINYHTVGSGFMEAYGINLVAGRYLSEYRSTDMIRPVGLEEVGNAATMINVSAARQLGFSNPVEAIGHVLRASIVSAGTQELEIVGVVEDVFFRSLKFEVRPSVYFDHPELVRAATLNFKTNDLAGLTVEVDAVWQKLVPATPISREFLTEMVYAQYEAEESQAQLFSVFSLLALIIGCLGLYGLASFAAERRTREIGIRKVMGARVLDIVRLLVWQFSLPVLFANFIACPLAIYAMHQWLQGFSYRIDTSLVLLAAFIAGVVALGISWLTVAARALKVANAKPIHALRYE
jgi:putative ABC transport system permease protein